jgi:hypothetical protein
LEILITKFPNVRVRYEYDKYALIHFIEVIPNEIYNLNNDYIAWENEMTDEFIELFPTENICFISDDALVGIENVELTLYGKDHTTISTIQQEQEMIIVNKNYISVSFMNMYNPEIEKFNIDYSEMSCQTYSLAA